MAWPVRPPQSGRQPSERITTPAAACLGTSSRPVPVHRQQGRVTCSPRRLRPVRPVQQVVGQSHNLRAYPLVPEHPMEATLEALLAEASVAMPTASKKRPTFSRGASKCPAPRPHTWAVRPTNPACPRSSRSFSRPVLLIVIVSTASPPTNASLPLLTHSIYPHLSLNLSIPLSLYIDLHLYIHILMS